MALAATTLLTVPTAEELLLSVAASSSPQHSPHNGSAVDDIAVGAGSSSSGHKPLTVPVSPENADAPVLLSSSSPAAMSSEAVAAPVLLSSSTPAASNSEPLVDPTIIASCTQVAPSTEELPDPAASSKAKCVVFGGSARDRGIGTIGNSVSASIEPSASPLHVRSLSVEPARVFERRSLGPVRGGDLVAWTPWYPSSLDSDTQLPPPGGSTVRRRTSSPPKRTQSYGGQPLRQALDLQLLPRGATSAAAQCRMPVVPLPPSKLVGTQQDRQCPSAVKHSTGSSEAQAIAQLAERRRNEIDRALKDQIEQLENAFQRERASIYKQAEHVTQLTENQIESHKQQRMAHVTQQVDQQMKALMVRVSTEKEQVAYQARCAISKHTERQKALIMQDRVKRAENNWQRSQLQMLQEVSYRARLDVDQHSHNRMGRLEGNRQPAHLDLLHQMNAMGGIPPMPLSHGLPHGGPMQCDHGPLYCT